MKLPLLYGPVYFRKKNTFFHPTLLKLCNFVQPFAILYNHEMFRIGGASSVYILVTHAILSQVTTWGILSRYNLSSAQKSGLWSDFVWLRSNLTERPPK